jgi:hypothetical protein
MNTPNEKIILGLDLGNTIVSTTPCGKVAFDDAIRVISCLVKNVLAPQRVFIVSRVNEEQYKRAKAWIEEERFLEQTGILPENVHWCAERSDKAEICKKLGITHFIDDRPEVVSHMLGIVPNRILFQANEEDTIRFKDYLDGVIYTNTWREIEKIFFPLG